MILFSSSFNISNTMSHKLFIIFIIFNANNTIARFADAAATLIPPQDPSQMLHSQCNGLDPVYNENGTLNGYRGTCNVNKWMGTPSELNSMHSVDPNLINIKNINKPPPSSSLFDWLTPHHDIIRNHPHLQHAHFQHRHCIHKKQKGLFEYLGEMFGFSSDDHDHDHQDWNHENFDPHHLDPYAQLPIGSRCLDSQYYNNNPFSTNDPYSIHLSQRIHRLRSQMHDPMSADYDDLRNDLNGHYDRLHRHLDCHCHHELPQSRSLQIHHRPIGYHSLDTISQINSPIMHSPMQFDPSMDMEDEHMAMLRMSGMASQHAQQQAYQQQHADLDSSTLQMQMFHPVNSYGVDPEWGRLRVEKVIVIKRLKVPVIKTVPVPVPVPSQGASTGQYSQWENVQPGYIGNNTYLTDSTLDNDYNSQMQMNSIIQAISGTPCGCLNNQIGDWNGDQMNYGYGNQMQDQMPMPMQMGYANQIPAQYQNQMQMTQMYNPNSIMPTPHMYNHNPHIYSHNPQMYDHNPQLYTHSPQLYSHNPQLYSHNPAMYPLNQAPMYHPNIPAAPIPALNHLMYNPNPNTMIQPGPLPYYNRNRNNKRRRNKKNKRKMVIAGTNVLAAQPPQPVQQHLQQQQTNNYNPPI